MRLVDFAGGAFRDRKSGRSGSGLGFPVDPRRAASFVRKRFASIAAGGPESWKLIEFLAIVIVLFAGGTMDQPRL